MEEKKLTIITGTVGQDSHTIGVSLLSRFLRENGFNVVELKGLTPPEDFIKAAKETDAVAILVSSLYGMGEMDLAGFKDKCIEAGLKDVLLYVGGYLKVGRHDWKEDEERFKRLGFDRVYPPEVELDQVLEDLKEDLKKKGKL
ncbi:MAG: methylaspartate mutase subunit S [Deltaproteobacteria bacterium]|nr:MAG: methylaspartate mutase subunit S [Deltaproteobacteria bacterium]